MNFKSQPLFFLGRKLVARPVDGLRGVRVEAVEMIVRGAVFVVVALHAGDVHLADNLETFLGVGVVADNVAEAHDVIRVLGADVLKDHLKGFQVSVDVGDDGVFH